jgi:UDP-N-acetylmuramoylalanine--D-glutamate ligase
VTPHRPPLAPGPWLVVGLARSGASAARLLWSRGEPVICVDSGDPAEAAALREAGMEVWTGVSGLAELERARAVVKSPGVPPSAPVVAQAVERGVPVCGELELGWRLLDRSFVAVTGTNGKTTAVELLGEIWRAAGREVALAGNVGTPVTSLVDGLPDGATVICEASSYQLHDAVAFAPEVGLILNLTPDHLAWHGTLDAYRAAKLRLFGYQTPAHVAVGPRDLLAQAGGEARRVVVGREPGDDLALRDGALWWEGARLIGLDEIRLPGAHNAWNAAGAAAAALAAGIDPEPVAAALRTFAGVEHRLEEVRTLDGVTWVNDSKSTNIASTTVALDTFDAPIHLILGGQAKDQDFTTLRGAICARALAVYVIGEDATRIADDLDGTVPLYIAEDLKAAVRAARGTARGGEIVLLSPASASFDQFADYEQRGRAFKALVTAL